MLLAGSCLAAPPTPQQLDTRVDSPRECLDGSAATLAAAVACPPSSLIIVTSLPLEPRAWAVEAYTAHVNECPASASAHQQLAHRPTLACELKPERSEHAAKGEHAARMWAVGSAGVRSRRRGSMAVVAWPFERRGDRREAVAATCWTENEEAGQVKSSHVKSSRAKSSHTSSQVEPSRGKSSWTENEESGQVKSSHVKSSRAKSSHASSQVEENRGKSSQVKPSRAKSSQVEPSQAAA